MSDIFDENECYWLSRRENKKKIVYCPGDKSAWAKDGATGNWLQSPKDIIVNSIVKAEETASRMILGWIVARGYSLE